MNAGHWRRRELVALLAGAAAGPALAQFRVEVTGVGLTQLPIAIAPWRGEEGLPQKISAIVQADLERSGLFRAVSGSAGAGRSRHRGPRSPLRRSLCRA